MSQLPPLPESLRIRRFDEIPSPEEFASEIESRNVPAVISALDDLRILINVFSGCTSNWKAFSKWSPVNGGLDYLQEKVGSSDVEAMLSQSAPVFNGDIRSHERVSLQFSTFIGYCKDVFQSSHGGENSFIESKNHLSAESGDEEHGFSRQIYLAQVPILNRESTEKVQLAILRDDFEMPPFLKKKAISSINLWMNSAQTRSTTHYDPHHNLLCIVTGCKQVVLWPPSASHFLYPLPIYGEASNHSAVPVEKSNYHSFPRAECSEIYSQKVILHAGDALFLPEGWYHQVDSECLTIAVNFWWRSDVMSGLVEHMDSYYFRIILRRLIDREMEITQEDPLWSQSEYIKINQMLYMPSDTLVVDADAPVACNDHGAAEEKTSKERIGLHELDPYIIKPLHELVALVHGRVNPRQEVSSPSADNLVIEEKMMKADPFYLKDDSIANILWSLEPHVLKLVLLAMAHNFPRTLEALILHALSPVGAEVLTRKFEEMDRLIGEEDRNQFYQVFYSVFDDQFSAMNVLLNGKESFSHKAYKNVLDQYLGINSGG